MLLQLCRKAKIYSKEMCTHFNSVHLKIDFYRCSETTPLISWFAHGTQIANTVIYLQPLIIALTEYGIVNNMLSSRAVTRQ